MWTAKSKDSHMLYKIALSIYYLFIIKIPNSRNLKLFNKFRVWYVSKILKLINNPEGCVFEQGVYISAGKERVVIGKHTHINENTFIQAATIGDYVMIGPNVSLLSNSHNHNRLDIPMEMQGMTENMPVIIENDVWIGRNVVVLPGITIHQGSIVAAGAIVTKNVQSYSIVGGVPARFIKMRR
jgi:acetyltransferase-like isoleucine patch superfamily enzyme